MKKNKVSVCCLAYNHGKYIRQTLEGFVSQKTNFPFEVLVNDDASADNTADIIREYAKKYPDIIKPVYQTENQYSKGVKIIIDILLPMAEGEYIAFCEGDDFWNDETKLQRQVDVMENNPDVAMVCHNTLKITCDGKPINTMINGLGEGFVPPENFINKRNNKNPHFSSLLLRRIVCRNKRPDFFRLTTGDNAWRLYSLCFGKAYYIDRVMSAYRTFVPGSWSSRMRDNRSQIILHVKNTIEFLKKYDEYTNGKFAPIINDVVLRREFDLCWLSGEYANAYELSKKVEIPFKQRAILFFSVYFPYGKNVINKFRRFLSKGR